MKLQDENLIQAFCEGTTAADIMRRAGISRTRYYRLVRDPEFQAAVAQRRSEIVDAAVKRMERTLDHNVMILQTIIDDVEVAAQTRVNAVNVMLSQFASWKSIDNYEQRLLVMEEFKAEYERGKNEVL